MSDKSFPDGFPETCRGDYTFQGLRDPATGKFEAVSSCIFKCACGSTHFHILSDTTLRCAGCGRYAGSNNLRWD